MVTAPATVWSPAGVVDARNAAVRLEPIHTPDPNDAALAEAVSRRIRELTDVRLEDDPGFEGPVSRISGATDPAATGERVIRLCGELLPRRPGQPDDIRLMTWRAADADGRTIGGRPSRVDVAPASDPAEGDAVTADGSSSKADTDSRLRRLLAGEPIDEPEATASEGPDPAVVQRIAEEAVRTFDRHLESCQAPLIEPHGRPGSDAIRRGVASARRGRWAEARRTFASAADGFASDRSAWLNLAVADVAAQDFDAAREHFRRGAGRFWDAKERRIMAWIEWQHRRYATAFDTPPPPGGWWITRPTRMTPSDLSLP